MKVLNLRQQQQITGACFFCGMYPCTVGNPWPIDGPDTSTKPSHDCEYVLRPDMKYYCKTCGKRAN